MAGQDGPTWYLPAKATEFRDVCEAGDTLLHGAASGRSMEIRIATHAVLH
jgi:hypothetical protein